MTAIENSATGVTWDLRDLYDGADDLRIQADLAQAADAAEALAADYRGTLHVPGGPDPAHLRAGLERLATLYELAYRPVVFAHLLFSANTGHPQHRTLLQQTEERVTAVLNTVVFFQLEWLALPADVATALSAHPTLAPYQHYLQAARRYVSHALSEPEEQLINEKDLTGAQAWRTLFAELIAGLAFPLERDGQVQTLELDHVLALLRTDDRTIRARAFATLYDVLAGQAQTIAFLYNTLIQDHQAIDRMRGYANPMLRRHLSNEIDPAAVDTMMEVVEEHYPLAQRFFRLKARLLNLPHLELYDQYASVGAMPGQRTYEEAQQIILHAFGQFDTRFADIAAQSFAENWIDAELRAGKRGGAFCSSFAPQYHPYILCNYTDDLRDVMTIAHELGHGIHAVLSGKQHMLNYQPTLTLAETASVFCEMLVFEHLLAQEQHPAAQLGLVCNKIDDIFATVFRQNVLTRFEQAVYAARATQGRLTPEQISAHWLEANQRYYGDAVAQTPGYEGGWLYIQHFINTPFYCYSYVFGELLVLALYSLYREQGAAFVPHIVTLLEAGGSQAPETLLADLHVDMRDADFWRRGLAELERLIGWAEELATHAP